MIITLLRMYKSDMINNYKLPEEYTRKKKKKKLVPTYPNISVKSSITCPLSVQILTKKNKLVLTNQNAFFTEDPTHLFILLLQG